MSGSASEDDVSADTIDDDAVWTKRHDYDGKALPRGQEVHTMEAINSRLWRRCSLLNLNDRLDLDGDVERQRVRADCTPRVHAALTEDVRHQVGATIHDAGLPRKLINAVDEAYDFDDPLHAV